MAEWYSDFGRTRLNSPEERPYNWDPQGYRYDWGYGENPHYWDYTPHPYYVPRSWYSPYGEGYEAYKMPPESQDIEYNRAYNASNEGPYSGVGPRNYSRSDDRIEADICDRMTTHGHLDASDIEVNVHNGEVTLAGTVPDCRSKGLAEEIADSVAGVADVQNELSCKP